MLYGIVLMPQKNEKKAAAVFESDINLPLNQMRIER